MELAIIVIVLIVIGLIVFQARKITISFNRKIKDEFNFKPIKFERVIVGAIPFFLIFIGLIIDSYKSNNLNTTVAGILTVAVIFLLHKYIKERTTVEVATKATLIIIVYGLFLMCLCVLVLFFYSRAKSNEEIDRWYYPRYWW